MWIKRDIENILTRSTSIAKFIIGPRQTGKTTLFRKLNHGRTFVTLDDLNNRLLAQNDPAMFFEKFTGPLLIDEIHYAPNLFLEMKKRIDEYKFSQLQTNENNNYENYYLCTGSDQVAIDKNVKESLVGRAIYFQLYTLSVNEILCHDHNIQIKEILFKGGFPEIYAHQLRDVKTFHDQYIRTYIEKDIVQTSGISKVRPFLILVKLLAARIGEILNQDDLAKSSGVRSEEIKQWLSALERTGIIYLLRPYFSNLNKRLTKSPKIYFLDNGIAARLQGHLNSEQLFHSPQAGHFFENLVLSEIVKLRNNFSLDFELFLWRTKDGEEFDFVLKGNEKILILDAKMSLSTSSPLMTTSAIEREFKNPTLVLVKYGGENEKWSDRLFCIPLRNLSQFLQTQFS